MKKFLAVLLLFVGALVLIACDKPDDGDKTPTVVATGIMLSDTEGQGSASDPFVFTLKEGETISSTITVAPTNVTRNLMFTLVKKVGDTFQPLASGDIAGIELTSENGNQKLSFKALKAGTHYLTIGQDSVLVYVMITVTSDNVEPEPDPDVDFTKTLKVLAIGNSFSQDGMSYLYQIAKSYGVEEVILGNLVIGGAELSQHANNAASNSNAYLYQKNTSGSWVDQSGKSLLYGLEDEDWDIITVQQASGKSGRPEYYDPHLDNLLTYIETHKTNEKARIYWHLTWAYQQNSTHAEFPFYESKQSVMYDAIINTYNQKVKVHTEIKGIIPSGTAVQNVRTSFIGDNMTHDGYHLNSSVGRYTASLTWFKAITKLSIDNITYRPSGVSDEQALAIKEGVNNAIVKPLEITLSTYTEDGGELNLSLHTLLTLNWQLGYYVSTDSYNIYTNASNTKYFTTHDYILSKENLPVGSVLMIEDGYHYRVNYFKAIEGPTTGNVRSDNLTAPVVVIDEAWWGDFNYVAFNVAHRGSSTDITNTFQTVASKMKIYAAPNATLPPRPHIDMPLTFVSGYWNDNATQITNNGGSFDKGFAASNVLSKASLEMYEKVTIATGYKVRVVFFEYDGYGGYKVLYRTANVQGTIMLDELFWEDYLYMGFNISSEPSTDISGMLAELPSKIVFGEKELIDHEDKPLGFELGFYELEATSKTLEDTYATTNIVTRQYLSSMLTMTVLEGYEVKAVFFTYDGAGTYKAVHKSEALTGEVLLNNNFWGAQAFVAFEITKVEPADLTAELETLISKVVFSDQPLVEHEDKPLTFISGYWADNATKVTNAGGSFDLGFAASNVFSRSYIEAYSQIIIESGYQVRAIFLTYDGFGGYKVVLRSSNIQGTITLDNAFLGNYEYFAFNIASVPSSDLSGQLETLPSKLTFVEKVNEEGINYNFVSGYWADAATNITNTGTSFDLGFAATTNPMHKDKFADITSFVVAQGFQVRVVYFTPQNGGWKVLYRTANFTGEIFMDDTFWGTYEYVGFNISSVPSSNLSSVLDTLASKITFMEGEIIPHVDEALTYVSGYWNDGGTAVTNNGGSFDLGFAASNVLSKAYLMNYTHIYIPSTHQARIVFLSYDNRGTYTVLLRTDNTNGLIKIDESFFKNYQYVALTVSSLPSTDLSTKLEDLALIIELQVNEQTPEAIDFSLGYWSAGNSRLDTTSSNHVSFIGSNVLTKDFVGVETTLTIEEGYQVRIIFFTVDHNIAKVALRTDNYTGTVLLTEELWGSYNYIGFNISKVGTPNISTEIELTATKITLTKAS
ncbi:DUF4886 domain-containing protein [Acholeplasma hippikon]|uniref:DUF4886 domain-containing protein n=1 Tax=Acholeplasma hippikon TaxID=264636 RepID=A0A449BLI5_9MOLU|nr:DUF4886 domain-containing protein [Acholeplasma hippikon]VEU83300.1 Uncharacterised protein [Acholeplasma hippikon]